MRIRRKFKKNKKRQMRRRLILAGLIPVALVLLIDSQLRPVIRTMAAYQANTCAVQAVNEAVYAQVAELGVEYGDLVELNTVLLPIIPLKVINSDRVKGMKKNQLKQELKEEAIKLYEMKEAEFPEAEQMRELERVVLLKVIDRKWMDHIDDMEQLRQGVGLAAYGQRDPKVEYKMSAFEMFDAMTSSIQQDTIRLLYHVRIEQKVEREQVAQVTGTNKDESVKGPVRRAEGKVYPNDPCPCGSGKKYKQCCGRKLIKA